LTGDAAASMHSIQVHVNGPAGPPIEVEFGECPGLGDAFGCLIDSTFYVHQRLPFVVEHEFGHLSR
jgi:hypothetical protein